VLAARRRLVRLWPEVRHPGDQPVSELEEHRRVIGPAVKEPLEPHHAVPLVRDRDLRPQVPVAGILLVERQVPVASADPLPRLRDLVDHVRMQEPGPGIPVACLKVEDEELD
jgi:hypothetical protein